MLTDTQAPPLEHAAPRIATDRASAFQSNLNLTRELAVTAFKLKYTGSVLGYAWSLVKPLLIFGMTYFVFAVFLLKGRTSRARELPGRAAARGGGVDVLR